MLESCNKILQYTDNMDFQAFCNDSKTLDAVNKNFEIIGEAANRLLEDLKTITITSIGTGFMDLETELFTITWALTSASFGK